MDLKVTTKRDGSLTPVMDNVQTFAVNADGGSFTLTVNVPQPGSTTVLSQTTAAIAYNATAAEIRTALDPILNPNGSILDPFNPRNDNSRPYTNNVTVTKVGNVVTIAFQGEHRGKAVTAVDTTSLTNTAGTASIDAATRHNGINYYGVETLNVSLGSGSDIFNVQGTSSVTNLNTAAGNDRVIVSSNANVNTGNLVTLRSGETADLGFRVSEAAASVSIDVKDSSGAIVRTFALGATAAGDYSQAWDGKDTAGNLVSAGTYSYTVTGKRTVSSFVMSSGDTPTLAFSLAEAATAVTIDVTDTSGTLVKTISLGATAAGAGSTIWNGTNTSGALVAAGAYNFTATGTRADTTTFAGIVSTFSAVGTVANVSGFLAGNVVSFSGDDRPELQFELAEAAASVSVDIRDAAGSVVRTLTLGATAAGAYAPAWDGKDTAGAVATAGAYSYTVTATRADATTFAGTMAMRGTLDGVRGLLNIDAGAGTNALMVSDAGSRVADTVVITKDK
ncbi:MAG: FlgD immunoglobulin-like domain containing protein, partial [Chloroflexota bacterium]